MVIEQYTITNKYNFPQPTIDTTLPQRFLEQSLYSLKQVQHQPLQLNPQNFQQFSTTEQYPSNLQLKPQPIPIKPDHQETLNRRRRHLNNKNRRNSHRHHRCHPRRNHLAPKPHLQVHAPRTIHFPHNRRQQKRTLQHTRTRLFQHQLTAAVTKPHQTSCKCPRASQASWSGGCKQCLPKP